MTSAILGGHRSFISHVNRTRFPIRLSSRSASRDPHKATGARICANRDVKGVSGIITTLYCADDETKRQQHPISGVTKHRGATNHDNRPRFPAWFLWCGECACSRRCRLTLPLVPVIAGSTDTNRELTDGSQFSINRHCKPTCAKMFASNLEEATQSDSLHRETSVKEHEDRGQRGCTTLRLSAGITAPTTG
jgi:hypothetical protein